ncbi:50S ribosomal protein L10 [Candidatus Babeliales bacterium]|nr:50S ribosomal protein L10 [Candidatus Babeliales bacterium]
MNRQEKSVVVDSLKQQLQQSASSFVVDYKGLSVHQLEALRKNLRGQGSLFKVAKARLMKRAVADLDAMSELNQVFKDQIGLVFSPNQAAQTAKSLYEFAKENEKLGIVAGYTDSQFLSKQDIIALATLPSREVLLAMLCGVLMAPLSSFVRALDQIAKKPTGASGENQ